MFTSNPRKLKYVELEIDKDEYPITVNIKEGLFIEKWIKVIYEKVTI
jgi:hypothetical protein